MTRFSQLERLASLELEKARIYPLLKCQECGEGFMEICSRTVNGMWSASSAFRGCRLDQCQFNFGYPLCTRYKSSINRFETNLDYKPGRSESRNPLVNNPTLLIACRLAFMENFLSSYNGIGEPKRTRHGKDHREDR